MGWLIGISHNIVSDISYQIVPVYGIILANRTVQHVTKEDYMDHDIKTQSDEFKIGLGTQLDDKYFQLLPMYGFTLRYLHVTSS